MDLTPTLSLCKMCARMTSWRSGTGTWMCLECRDYIMKMADMDTDIGIRVKHGLSMEIPPWEMVALRRAQEFIESELAESMLF